MRRALLGKSSISSLDLNFLSGSLDPRITFTRASGATYYDATGTMRTAATNAPRIDYGPTPGGVTNYIRNSTLQGATVGTPGVLPTFMSIGSVSGVAFNVVNITTVNGLPCFDIQVVGTPATSATVDLTFDSVAMGAYLNFTESVSTALVGGSMNNIAVAALTAGTGGINVAANTTATLTRVSVSSTGLSFNPGAVTPGIRFSFTASQAVNAIIRIGGPQFEYAPTVGTYVPTTGAINTVGAIPLGLLIEEQRTNLYTFSGAMTNAPWGMVGSTPTSGFTAPDGTATAVFLKEDTSTGGHQIAQLPVIASGTTYTHSIFAKAGTRHIIYINGMGLGGASLVPLWDLTAGTDITTGSAAGFTHGIQPLLNGWYRCWFTWTATNTTAPIIFMDSVAGTSIYTGDGVSGLYLWGADLQAGAFATSYIPTTSAAATRAADTATIPVRPWYNQSAGTFAVEASMPVVPNPNNAGLIEPGDGTLNNRMPLFMNTSGQPRSEMTTAAAGGSPNVVGVIPSAGSVFKVATTYSSISRTLAANGSGVGSGTIPAGGVPVVTTLRIGQLTGFAYLDGYIRRVRYWPRALADAELQGNTQ
jgi:hypothetical protein